MMIMIMIVMIIMMSPLFPDDDAFVDPDPGLLSDPPEISVAKDMLQFHPKVLVSELVDDNF